MLSEHAGGDKHKSGVLSWPSGGVPFVNTAIVKARIVS
jgi:hypothetical protein